MVLETAVNGRTGLLVTFNQNDFAVVRKTRSRDRAPFRSANPIAGARETETRSRFMRQSSFPLPWLLQSGDDNPVLAPAHFGSGAYLVLKKDSSQCGRKEQHIQPAAEAKTSPSKNLLPGSRQHGRS